jgi:hypothetical protein
MERNRHNKAKSFGEASVAHVDDTPIIGIGRHSDTAALGSGEEATRVS